MQNSETLVVIALFGSTEGAHSAIQSLSELGITAERVRISAECVLHVRVAGAELDRVSGVLLAASAQDLTVVSVPEHPGWMSHILDHVLGQKIMPGEGDSEAGVVGRWM
jgi:hypothetical protein